MTRIESAAELEISGAAGKTFDQRTLEVQGSALMSGTGTATMRNGASILNSGDFELRGDGDFLYENDSSAAVQFTNLSGGILRKTSGTGITEFGGSNLAFNNAGLVAVQTGTIFFANGFTQTAGTLALAGGGISAGSPILLQGGELTGAGTITGNVVNSGATVRPGGTGLAGTLTIAGNYQQDSTGTLAVELGGTAAGTSDVLAITGTASLGGTLNVANLGAFAPATGQQFRVVSSPANPGSFATLTGQTAGLSQIPNASGLVLITDSTVPAPDLVLGGSNGVSTITPGQTVLYNIEYRNAGTRVSSGVEITETLPVGTSFNSAASSPGWLETAPGSGIYKYLVGSLGAWGRKSERYVRSHGELRGTRRARKYRAHLEYLRRREWRRYLPRRQHHRAGKHP